MLTFRVILEHPVTHKLAFLTIEECVRLSGDAADMDVPMTASTTSTGNTLGLTSSKSHG
jgi:hypothetical protein